MTSGVYILKFNSGNCYIGKSIDIPTRWKQHFDKFNKGTAAKAMQAEFNRYGYPQGEILMECHADHIDIVEACLINRMKPALNGTYPDDPFKHVDEASFYTVLAFLKQSTLDHIVRLVNAENTVHHNKELIMNLEEEAELLKAKRDAATLAADLEGRIHNLAELIRSRDDQIYQLKRDLVNLQNRFIWERKPWYQKLFS